MGKAARIASQVVEGPDHRVAAPDLDQRGAVATTLERVAVDLAYGGSCTGGKAADMDLYARVLRGRRVKDGVRLFIQFGSQAVRRYAEERGYVELFRAAGAAPDRTAIPYCRMSHRATVLYFVLTQLLDYKRVKVYDGSWTEWGNLVNVPVER